VADLGLRSKPTGWRGARVVDRCGQNSIRPVASAPVTTAGARPRRQMADHSQRGPVRLDRRAARCGPGASPRYLPDAGVSCAEHFRSDTNGYACAQQRPNAGPAVYIRGDNSGPFQVAGDHAHQEQRVNSSGDDLRQMIASIADLVATVAPGAADDAAQKKAAALAAARDGAVDKPALRRFADWALSVVGRGATAALVPAVTAATNDMLNEAHRLTGHL
jgi:hypothetical protein